MDDLNQRLVSEDHLRSALEESTRRYMRLRDLISPLPSARHPGGGPERVKCLHAHTAHHLVSDDNPVGQEVLETLGWVDPERPCV
jgi:hypothetical protein